MKATHKFAVALLLASGASFAQATTYNVAARFSDGGIQGQTLFNGSFDWDGAIVSNFQGYLSESMYGWNSGINSFDSNGTAAGGTNATGYTGSVWTKPGGYADNEAPLLHLTNQLASSASGNYQTVTTFLQNSTDVVMGGGYDVKSSMGTMKFGNSNAFFTLVFDQTNPINTSVTFNQSIYGDFTALGLMPPLTGTMGMTGWGTGAVGSSGTMGGYPTNLTITAVPVPAPLWLLGSAFTALATIRRRSKMPA